MDDNTDSARLGLRPREQRAWLSERWVVLPYHFKTKLNLLDYCILCESESLYLIRSMHDQNLLIPHTFYHITTTSRKFLYFMLIFIKKHPHRAKNGIIAPITTYSVSYLVAIVYPIIFGGPRVVVSTAASHARVRRSVPGLGGLKETMFLPHPHVKVSIVGSLRDQEVACSASDRQGSNFQSCVWRTVSSQSSHHPQEVRLAQFSLYVHKGGLKPDSFHFIVTNIF